MPPLMAPADAMPPLLPWTGDTSHRSLLEVAAAHGLPLAVVPRCGVTVRAEWSRRHPSQQQALALRQKEFRGEMHRVVVYPAGDVAWIAKLLHRESQGCCLGCGEQLLHGTGQGQWGRRKKRRAVLPCCRCEECVVAAQPTAKRRKGSASCVAMQQQEQAGIAALLSPQPASASGPWSAAVAVQLAEGVSATEVHVVDALGYSAAHRLAKWGYTEALRVLVDKKGAGVDTRTTEGGRTALMAAGIGGCVGTLRLLLLSGADWRAVDEAGHTALDLARERCALGRRKNHSVLSRFAVEASLVSQSVAVAAALCRGSAVVQVVLFL
jgi:hypothetical protein